MDLKSERQKIDVIDQQIVQLLEERMLAVTNIADYKLEKGLAVLDTTREEQVREKVAGYVKIDSFKETIVESFQDIMNRSREYQAKRMETKRDE
ncbi:MAG: chorismate mutase [Lactobacillales bacterium]|jgi:maltose O-acetyltransferase|nr:chorismate mutase [Lactobacillales bacterium]